MRPDPDLPIAQSTCEDRDLVPRRLRQESYKGLRDGTAETDCEPGTLIISFLPVSIRPQAVGHVGGYLKPCKSGYGVLLWS